MHVEHWVQSKEKRNDEIKRIISHVLGDDVWTITEWAKILMGSCKAFFLHVKPNFVARLKLMWHSMLIMALLVLVMNFCRIS
jgi:hypothetical protein